jgi:hypothetical protein
MHHKPALTCGAQHTSSEWSFTASIETYLPLLPLPLPRSG